MVELEAYNWNEGCILSVVYTIFELMWTTPFTFASSGVTSLGWPLKKENPLALLRALGAES